MEKLNDLVEIFRKETHLLLENNNTFGICYLLAHCLNGYFTELGYDSRKVSGKLALLKKGNKTRYATYGTFKPSNYKSIGLYHTWCEVQIDDITYIIDASLVYNKSFLKMTNTTLSNQIPDYIITSSFNTHYYKFVEDDTLSCLALDNLSQVSPKLIDRLIDTSLSKARQHL